MLNTDNKKLLNKMTSLVLLICLVITGNVIITEDTYAAINSNGNGQMHFRTTDAAIVFYGINVDEGDGFTNSFRYLTSDDIKYITDERTADEYFSSDDFDTYVYETKFSGRRKNDEWYLRKVTKGLDLAAVGDSLGADTTTSPSYSYDIYTGSTDKYAGTIPSPFETIRYCFPAADAPVGAPVNPVLAFSAENDNDGVIIGDMPLVMFGQTSALNDYNMQNWAKFLNKLSFGEKVNVLSVNVNNTESKRWTIADILQSDSGLYTSTYEYMDGNDEVFAKLTGVPLDVLLKDKGIDLDIIKTLSIQHNGETLKEIAKSDMNKYFVAASGTASINNGAETNIIGTSAVQIYCPGQTKENVVVTTAKNLFLSIDKPQKVTNFKVKSSSYNANTLSWTSNPGADGYYIDRYDSKTKTWKNDLIDIENPNTANYTDKNLRTGTKYSYRIRAYKIMDNMEIEGDNSAVVSATPALGKTKIKSAKKSGKKNIVLKWNKVTGANGYEIYRATKKKGKYKKVKTITKGATAKWTNKKLKTKKTYYYKVRPYRNVDGKKVYSSYSTVRKVKR